MITKAYVTPNIYKARLESFDVIDGVYSLVWEITDGEHFITFVDSAPDNENVNRWLYNICQSVGCNEVEEMIGMDVVMVVYRYHGYTNYLVYNIDHVKEVVK